MSTGKGGQKRPAGKDGGHPPKKPKPTSPQQGTARPSQGSSSSTDLTEADIAYVTACNRFEELCKKYSKVYNEYLADIRKQRNKFASILSKAKVNKDISLQQIADKQKTVEEQQQKLAAIEESVRGKFEQVQMDNLTAYDQAKYRAKRQAKQELVNPEDVRVVSLTPEGKAAIEQSIGLLEKAKAKAKIELAALEENLIEEIKKLITEHEDLSKMMDEMELEKTDNSPEDEKEVRRKVKYMPTAKYVYQELEVRGIDYHRGK